MNISEILGIPTRIFVCSWRGHYAIKNIKSIDENGKPHGNWICLSCGKCPLHCTDTFMNPLDIFGDKKN